MMDKNKTKKSLLTVVGTAFAASLVVTPVANAEENPFAMTELTKGYSIASGHQEGTCGEGKCGAKEGEGSTDENVEGETTTDENVEEGASDGSAEES